MEFFARAKAVRLRSHNDKYLVAEEDEEHVTQDRDGTCNAARWTVEFVDKAPNLIRLRSCYGLYLTASNEPFLLGVTGKKVLQTLPARLDSSIEWEPIREGTQVKLKTRYGKFLRGNGGVPPWRNSVTHDVPHRTATHDWVIWEVDVVEILSRPPAPRPPPAMATSPSLEPSDSFSYSTPLHMVEGRRIYYTVADEDGNVDDSVDWPSLTFNGTDVAELTEMLMEKTELEDIIVCTRNPLNQKLIPLYLQLPPNNVSLRLVVVDANSEVAKDFI